MDSPTVYIPKSSQRPDWSWRRPPGQGQDTRGGYDQVPSLSAKLKADDDVRQTSGDQHAITPSGIELRYASLEASF